ncbi:hypothetical protein ANO14919_079190 [Xylariales sp. No.14919]|nr:hypothetical protein ANO14919_079190 [Xylariales sp. No.14919]
MSTNPNSQIMLDLAVVIRHSSYYNPAPHTPLVDLLKAVGINAYHPQLPTSDLTRLNVGDTSNPDFDREPPSGGYPQGPDDAETILGILNPLILEGKRVLIVGHSVGGWVATDVAKPELQEKTRGAQSLAGGIIRTFYISAFIVPVGKYMASFLKYQSKEGSFIVPPFLELHKPG